MKCRGGNKIQPNACEIWWKKRLVVYHGYYSFITDTTLYFTLRRMPARLEEMGYTSIQRAFSNLFPWSAERDNKTTYAQLSGCFCQLFKPQPSINNDFFYQFKILHGWIWINKVNRWELNQKIQYLTWQKLGTLNAFVHSVHILACWAGCGVVT